MNGIDIARRSDYQERNMNRVYSIFEAFKTPLSETEKHLFDQVFSGIDYADQLADDWQVSSNNILDFMVGKVDSLAINIPLKVETNFKFLRSVVSRNKTGIELEMRVAKLLELQTKRREATTPNIYVDMTKREGNEHAEIALLFLNRELPSELKEFLRHANILGNLADNLIDLEEDYSKGELSMRPSARLRLGLKLAITRELAYLCLKYPKKEQLPFLVAKYVGMISKE